jgi:hypothetical protein
VTDFIIVIFLQQPDSYIHEQNFFMNEWKMYILKRSSHALLARTQPQAQTSRINYHQLGD